MQIDKKATVVRHLHAFPAQDSPAQHRKRDELKDCITDGIQDKELTEKQKFETRLM